MAHKVEVKTEQFVIYLLYVLFIKIRTGVQAGLKVLAGRRKEKGGTMIVVSDGKENRKPKVSEVVDQVRITSELAEGASHFQMGGGEGY